MEARSGNVPVQLLIGIRLNVQSEAHSFQPKNGAEAKVYLAMWHGEPAVRKIRESKIYRNPSLDQSLRSKRTKQETVVLHSAKLGGVLCPKVMFADPERCEIVMEYIRGTHMKEIAQDPQCQKDPRKLYLETGKTIARLHECKIAHGDLTTKNILIKEGKIHLIDFGLSFFSERIEDQAEDLHLLKQALVSMNPPSASTIAFSEVMRGYAIKAGKKKTRKLLEQILEIEKRGRYARVD